MNCVRVELWPQNGGIKARAAGTVMLAKPSPSNAAHKEPSEVCSLQNDCCDYSLAVVSSNS